MIRWMHVQWSAYGAWLPGDPRGFRNHKGRIRSSGDYRRPPPAGEHAGLHRHAKRVMPEEAVELDRTMRGALLAALVEKAVSLKLSRLAVAVARTHVHAQLRIDDDAVDEVIGKLKRHSSHAVGEVLAGRVWAARCHAVVIRDRAQQRAVFGYIVAHRREGAAVWTFRD